MRVLVYVLYRKYVRVYVCVRVACVCVCTRRFWLYATIRARTRGLLISNDLLRDHIFQLLRPKHVLKWKARHIARYHWKTFQDQFVLDYPPNYTTCVQRLSNGVWMFPSAQDGTWLCAKPRTSGDAQQ